jgi:hypothetical protein
MPVHFTAIFSPRITGSIWQTSSGISRSRSIGLVTCMLQLAIVIALMTRWFRCSQENSNQSFAVILLHTVWYAAYHLQAAMCQGFESTFMPFHYSPSRVYVAALALANEQGEDVPFPWELAQFEDFVERYRTHVLPETQVSICLNVWTSIMLFLRVLYVNP